ncbi:MAG: carbohydrate ABC transporter permease [Clostridiales bacterium]|jgi:raffinose/stachyose/melibiose transport system permease protein|nr:carbohydrate ABC transporter permease [Clostridiales bacterium]
MKKISPAALIIKIVVLTLLFIYALTIIYPLIWMVIQGFRTNREFFSDTWGMPQVWVYQNYIDAWNFGIRTYFMNSVFVTATSVVLTVITSSLLAFFLTRYSFKISKLLLVFVLGGMMLSPQISVISLFQLLQTMNLYNTHWALIIPYVAFRIPFITFLMRGYFLGMPREIEEAAFIDGCSSFGIFLRVVLPIARPIIATSALLAAMTFWNEFMFGLVFIESDSLRTIPVGLMNLRGTLVTRWTTLIAGLALSAIPIIMVFLACQKQLVRGLTAGGVKG